MSPIPPRQTTVPASVAFPGMRVCHRPARCPYARPECSLASNLARWQGLLGAALPGDEGLAALLLGDIADLAVPEASLLCDVQAVESETPAQVS